MIRRASLGFTLVELVVVLLLLGLGTAAALPAVAALDRTEGQEAAERLADAYRLARRHATDSGDPASVWLDGATGAYLVIRGTGRIEESPSAAVLARGLLARPGSGVRLRVGTPERAGWALASFDPLGRARADQVVVLDGEHAYAVYVEPWTSAIEIEGGRIGPRSR